MNAHEFLQVLKKPLYTLILFIKKKKKEHIERIEHIEHIEARVSIVLQPYS